MRGRERMVGIVAALAAAAGLGAQRPSPTAVDCIACHPNVHATMIGAGEKTAERCLTCHAGAHAPVERLYTGIGTDSAVLPDRMYTARVACRECHTQTVIVATGAGRQAALNRACTSCHGNRFDRMLGRWTDAMARHTEAANTFVAAAAADSTLASNPAARARVESARADVGFVRKANGLHNVPGADALLRSAVRKVSAAYAAAGRASPAAPPLGPDPATVSCAYCHYGIEGASGPAFGKAFDHAAHVGRANVACTACHTSADYFVAGTHDPDPRHGRTTLSAASCNDCHHTRSTLSCATCHDATALATRTDSVTLPLHLRPRGAPASRRVAFSHAPHAGEACASCHTSRASVAAVGACASCHESHHRWATDCTACHGTDVRTHHRAANHLACAQCHALPTLQLLTGNRAFCLSCHVDRREHHPDRECAPCHLQLSPADVRSRILGGRR